MRCSMIVVFKEEEKQEISYNDSQDVMLAYGGALSW